MSESKYVIYVGETVNTTSLWVRRGGQEYPIYANTCGKSEWYSFDTNEYENTEATELSEAFIDYLAWLKAEQDSMFLASSLEWPEADPEWYEVEILNSISDPSMTTEQHNLLEWASEKSDWEPVEAND